MEQLKRDLEEALEQIDLLTKERDNLKDGYEDTKFYIRKLKDEIDDLKSIKEPREQTNSNDEVETLKKENDILRHELKIVELKLSLKKHDSKNEPDLKSENIDLRSQLSQVTSELDSIKNENVELEKYNIIVKGELTQARQQLKKIYSSSEKIDEQLSYQRPSYDKTGLGYLIGEKSAKKVEIKKEPDPVVESPKESNLSKIESSITIEVSKEIELVDLSMKHDEPKKTEQVDKAKKDEPPKEVRHELRGRCFICNEVGHIKRDCTSKSFKPITNLYCYRCHGYGHKVVNCKKPKFDSDNENSRMFRKTNPIGNERGRS